MVSARNRQILIAVKPLVAELIEVLDALAQVEGQLECADFADPWYNGDLCSQDDPRYKDEPYPVRRQCLSCFLKTQYGVAIDGLEVMDATQVRVIADALILLGDKLADLLRTCTGKEYTREQAFNAVFGKVNFKYTQTDADTDDFASHSKQPDGSTLVTLPEEQYDLFSTMQNLDMEWLIAHELGHAFHDRFGSSVYTDRNGNTVEMPTPVIEFLKATGSYYTVGRDFGYNAGNYKVVALTSLNYGGAGIPAAGYYAAGSTAIIPSRRQELENAGFKPLGGNGAPEYVYLNRDGHATNTPLYFREAGTYIATYTKGFTSLRDVYFFNELGSPNKPPAPIEGFADTFANFMRFGTDIMQQALNVNDPRITFFDPNSGTSKMCEWLNTLVNG
jgi:hypothetical protein